MVLPDRGRLAAHLRTPLYRDAYALVFANLLTSALGLVYWALAARLYVPERVGVDSALISTMLFLSAVTQLNLRVALLRFVPEAGHQTGRFVGLAYLSSIGGAVVLSAAFVLTFGLLASASDAMAGLGNPALAVWFVASTAIWSIMNLQDGLLTGLRRASLVPLENGLYSLAKILLLILFAVALDEYAIYLSWTVPAALTVAVVSVYAFGRLIPRHKELAQGRRIAMGRPRLLAFLALDYVASLFATMTATLLPILVIAFAGPGPGAYFYIAWIIITSLQLLPNYLAASLTVEAVRTGTGLPQHVRRVLLHSMRLLVPAALLLVIVAPVVLSIFGPDYGAEATDLLRLGAVGLIPYAVNILFVGVARVQGRGRVIIGVHAAVALVTFGLSAALLPWLGITAVGVAWLVANLTVSLPVIALGLWPLLKATVAAGPSA